jgi:hypothetical protein
VDNQYNGCLNSKYLLPNKLIIFTSISWQLVSEFCINLLRYYLIGCLGMQNIFIHERMRDESKKRRVKREGGRGKYRGNAKKGTENSKGA